MTESMTPADRKARQRARQVAAVPKSEFAAYLATAEQPTRAELLRSTAAGAVGQRDTQSRGRSANTEDRWTATSHYARRGWYVFPCKPGGKAPLTPRGLHDATRDPEQLARWVDRWPHANVGVRTGRESGIVVLDVDGDDGAESLRTLERRHGPLPRTASVKTPRGGAHYYFAHPGDDVPCSAGRLGVGLDVRGDGGYVLVPPSIGPNGVRYEPDEAAAVAMLPPWLRELMTPATTRGVPEPAETWVGMVRSGLAEGERNGGLARLVGHLLARDVDARLVAELAHLVNARSRPPLPDTEVDRVVASIAGREVRRRRGGAR